MKMLSKGAFFLTLAFTFLLPRELSAGHLYGGEISWDCDGGDFVFRLVLYRDCDGSAAPSSAQIDVHRHPSVNSIPLTLDSVHDISPSCEEVPGGPSEIECSGGGDGAVERAVFSSLPVSLNGTPPSDGWVFTWSGQTRSTAPDNLVNPATKGITIRSKMFGTGGNAAPCADNSPRFPDPPVTIMCNSNELRWSGGAVDPDADSLSYSWAQPLDKINGGTFDPPSDPAPIAFQAPFSYDEPFPGIQAGTGAADDRLDPNTGDLRINSNDQGSYDHVIKVTSWRNGQKTAEVYREIGLTLVDCPNNEPPEILPPFAGGFVDTFQYGQTLNFPVEAVDEEQLQDGSDQSIRLEVTGVAFGQNHSDPSMGCPEPPCATLSPAPSVNSVDTARTEFEWELDCAHLGSGGGSAERHKRYDFQVSAKDDRCSAPGQSRRTFSIVVENEEPVSPPELNCVSVQGGDLQLSWSQPPGAPHPTFDSYHIYRSDAANGPYTPVDTIFNIATTTYTDPGMATGSDKYYYIRVRSGCQGELMGAPSDTLRRIDLDVSNPNNGTAQLSWNELGVSDAPPNPGTGYYRIQQEHPMGTWTTIDSVPYGTTSYTDTIMVCSDSLSYRIAVPDHQRNCVSYSSIDGGNFSDVLAPSVPEIQNVSVDTSTSNATIDWSASPQPDTEGYLVLQIIGGTEYVIDTVWGRNNTFYAYSGSNASNMSENFAIAAFDSCYSGSPARPNTSTRGAIHNTMLIEGEEDPCERRMELSWNRYRNWDSGVKEYRLYFIEAGRSPVYAGKNPAGDTSMTHGKVPVNEPFCYVVQAVANDGSTALSAKRCFVMDVPEPPSFHYLSSASVLPGNEGIEVRSLVDPAAENPRLRLDRIGPDGAFEEVRTVQANGNAQVKIRDEDIDPTEGSFSYRITALDSCGNEVLVSNEGRSVHLRAEATREPPVNVLQWTSYREWDGSVSGYEVHRIDRKRGTDELLDVLSPQRSTYEHHVGEDVEEESGRYCYYVKALESGNSYGNDEVARSNEACAFQEPYIWIPNAYIIGGTSESFNAVTGHVPEDGYRLTIYDRWGRKLFESEDPHRGWKGRTGSGEKVREGVYVYHFIFRNSAGNRIERRGTVTLLHK